jgi:hypothetical protein
VSRAFGTPLVGGRFGVGAGDFGPFIRRSSSASKSFCALSAGDSFSVFVFGADGFALGTSRPPSSLRCASTVVAATTKPNTAQHTTILRHIAYLLGSMAAV